MNSTEETQLPASQLPIKTEGNNLVVGNQPPFFNFYNPNQYNPNQFNPGQFHTNQLLTNNANVFSGNTFPTQFVEPQFGPFNPFGNNPFGMNSFFNQGNPNANGIPIQNNPNNIKQNLKGNKKRTKPNPFYGFDNRARPTVPT